MKGRAAPIAFRMWAVSSRFILTFFLARYLEPADVGLYGLLAATSAYVVYILGMDLYTYTTREVIESGPIEWRKKIVSHATFLACVLVVVLPALTILFVVGLLPWRVIVWFYLIAVTEHLVLEIDRLLVAMSDQLAASFVILIRQAVLPTLYIPLLILVPQTRQVTTLFAGWVVFNAIAIALGVLLIAQRSPSTGCATADWSWVRRGLIVASPFLAGTLCLRLIFTADRQIVAALANLDVLGAYTLSASIAAGLTSVLAIGVHQFSYPLLVKAASQRDLVSFRHGVRSLWYQTAVVVGLAFIGVLIFHNWIASRFGQPIYVEYAWLMPAAVGCIGVYNLSLVPHYALYALHADRIILITTIIALAGFAGAIMALVQAGLNVVVSVLSGVLAASVLLLVAKYAAYRTIAQRT